MTTEPLPHGRTARRLQWRFLPPGLRETIERHCGSPVVQTASQDAGFTPGFASLLTCADGSRHFVKAASVKAQPAFAASYRDEARKLAALPARTPAPKLRWVEDGDWVVLGIEPVAARTPRRPWRPAELDRALDLCEQIADVLTPAPRGHWTTFAEDFADLPALWERIATLPADLDPAQLAQAAELAAGFAAVTGGDTLVHTDVRDDNVLLGKDRAWVCDWNWPCLGAPWIDSVALLVGAAADGLDVDAVLATRALTCDVPGEHIDVLLALLAGYWLKSAHDPVPASSPHIRTAQGILGEAAWSWLAARRGWS